VLDGTFLYWEKW
jgi:hypothetical protein